MKTTLAALFATALFASPALACGFKSAQVKHDMSASVKVEETTDKAMSTFDPAKTPAFDDTAEATVEPAPVADATAE